MRQPITVILTLSLLAATTGAVASAESAEPPPYPGDAGVTFEPVGPTAWRVVEPDLDCEREPFGPAEQTVVAPDGRAWLLDSRAGIRELGACPITSQVDPFRMFGIRDQALAPDGALWALDGDRLMSWCGSDWVVHVEGRFNVPKCTDGAKPITVDEFNEHGGECAGDCESLPCYLFLDIAPDGTIWLSGLGSLGRYANGVWHAYTEEWMGKPGTLGHGRLGFGSDGAVWVWGYEERYVFYP